MKKIILGLGMSMALFSCSKDDNTDKLSDVVGLKLIKEIETNLIDNKTQTINYTYENNILTKREETESNGDIYKTEFVYDNGKLKVENYFENSVSTGNNTFTYTGDVVSSTLFFEDNRYSTHQYTYNSSNQMTNAKQYHSDHLDDSIDFEYNSQGNMSKIIYTIFHKGNSIMEYDDKKNPYSLIMSESIMKSQDESGYSKNNVIKVTESDGAITTYEYIYNDKNYPTQVIEKLDGVPQSKTTFIYE